MSCAKIIQIGCVLSNLVRAEVSFSGYTQSAWPLDGLRFYWRFVQDGVVVDADSTVALGDDATFEFAISAPTVDGWIGFGVGETTSGSMPGADIMLSYIDNSGQQVGDYFTTDFARPEEDCTQPSDWEGVGYERNSTHTTVALQRLVGAVGNHDRDISTRSDGARLLFAYGDFGTDFVYHDSQRAMSTIVLHGPVESVEVSDTVFAWDLTQENFSVPSTDTTYENTACVLPPGTDDFGQSPIMIGYEVLVSSETMRPHLHHFLLHGFTDDACSGLPFTVLGVASKHDTVLYPNDTGMPFTYVAYSVEVHYDNPLMTSGLVDSSGMRLFYSYEQPANMLGLLSVGDPYVQTDATIPVGLSSWPYHCPGQCTSEWTESITVIGGMPHMHAVGATMLTEFYGPDDTLLGTHEAEYYSFETQHTAFMKESIVVPPGSHLVTTCTFDTPSTVEFSLASTDEMCIHFLLYYPAQDHVLGTICGQEICGGLDSVSVPETVIRSFGSSCDESSSTSTSQASDQESSDSTTQASDSTSTQTVLGSASACMLTTATVSVFATAAVELFF